MSTILLFFATFGLAFFVKESDGPCGVMNKARAHLLQKVFFFKLFECYFCVGCWAGLVVYLLSLIPVIGTITVWAFAGGTVSLMMGSILERLHRE
jgi:Protein of unknown function (DUF1360)